MNEIEPAINAVTKASDYGDGLKELALIPIILEKDHPDNDEVRKYSKKKGVFEFRLKISHAAFKAADERGQRRLIVDMILRSVSEMRKLAPRAGDYDKLVRDIREVADSRGWTRPGILH